MYENFTKNYENINFELSENEKETIKKKLENILVEKAEITCRSIKFCVKIMSKLLNYLTQEKEKNFISKTDLLLKFKLFMKVNRLIIENANQSVRNSTNKQKEFFNM